MIIIERTVNLSQMCKPEMLLGSAFTSEDGGHKFIITCRRNREDITLSGSVSGRLIRADNTSVQLTNSYAGIDSDGKAWVILPGNCYTVKGQFVLVIYHTDSDGNKVAIYSASGYIRAGQTDTIVDPENIFNIDSIQAIIDDMYAAIDDCEAATASAINSVRYDQSQTLTDAQKTVARTNIAAASASDLSSLFDAGSVSETVDLDNATTVNYWISPANKWDGVSKPNIRSLILDIAAGTSSVTVTANSTNDATIAFLTSNSHETGTSASFVSGTGLVTVSAGTTQTETIPAGTSYLYILYEYHVTTYKPDSVTLKTLVSVSELSDEIATKQDALTFDNSPTESSTNPVKSGGVYSAVAAKVNKPTGSPNGTSGQLLRTNGDGTTTWVDEGTPTDTQVTDAVDDWLTAHPEATTTVDFSIACKVFPTVADMAADNTLEAGDNVATRGYYASGDDGAANYVVSASHSGVFYITLENGLFANMLSETVVLNAEAIGIKKYAAAQESPDSSAMAENVTRFNLAVYNGIYLMFGAGYYYFSDTIQLARKNTYTIRGMAREKTHLFFPNGDAFLFSDPIYYNYYVIEGMHIHAYGHTIRCAEHCLTVLDSHFEWLHLESETGDCFHGPNYNVAHYIDQGGNEIYDTCVQNCVFDFVNASAPAGAAFANTMGMYNYYSHMNLVSCKYGFRNCDGIIEQLNTLGTAEDYFIYYDKANSYSLRWTFVNMNAEGLAKAFIYTEPMVAVPSGEDSRKPETANIMAIEKITAINSSASLRPDETLSIYPVTVHSIKNAELINSDTIMIPSGYPTNHDTETVKGSVLFRVGTPALYKYVGPTVTIVNGSMIYTTYEKANRVMLSRSNVPYTTLGSRNVSVIPDLRVKRLYGGKSVDVYETDTTTIGSTSQVDPDFDHLFCDTFVIRVQTTTEKQIMTFCMSNNCVFPGRIITMVNATNSVGNIKLLSPSYTNYTNYGLHSSINGAITIAPGQSRHFILSYDVNPNTNAVTMTWKPIGWVETFTNDEVNTMLNDVFS